MVLRFHRPFHEGDPRGVFEVLWALRNALRVMDALIRPDLAARRELFASIVEICGDLSGGISVVLFRLREARGRLTEDALLDSDEVAELLFWLDVSLDEDLRTFRMSRRLGSATEAYLNRPPEDFRDRPGVPKRRHEVVDPIHPASRGARVGVVAGNQRQLRQVLERLERDQLLLFQEIEKRLAEFTVREVEGGSPAAPLLDRMVGQFELLKAKVNRAPPWFRAILDLDEG